MRLSQADVGEHTSDPPTIERTRSQIAVPNLPSTVVERGRLVELIDHGVRGPLTLVSAPAGTGKTVAVATWVASGQVPGRVVWITLAEDTDAARLWTLLAEALHRTGVFDRDLLPAPVAGGADAFLSALASALAARREPVVLVLDCPIDLPRDSADQLHELLMATCGGLRLITLTRADPPLRLHLYRLNEMLVEIRTADLAFTADEARELLGRRGTPIPEDVADVLVARTRGWAAGLLMASMSLADPGDVRQAVHHIDGAAGQVAEYLLTEVLSRQPPGVRELLLRTSVVETLRPGLTEALGGAQASRSLAFLTRSNAFLEQLPDALGWYRYHPLFRELLAAQLVHEAPDRARELHLIGARWLAGEGLYLDAVRTALATGAWDEAAGILIENIAVARLLAGDAAGQLTAAFRALPPTATSMAALLVRAALALGSRRYEACAELLENAAAGPTPPSPAETLTMAVLSAVVGGGAGASVARVLAEVARARALLDEDERTAGHTELLLLVEDAAADALFQEGRFAEAAEACRVAVAAGEGDFPLEQANCMGRLAFMAAWSGHCRRAIRLADRANGLRATAHLPETGLPLSEMALAWAYTETADVSKAVQHATAAKSAAIDTDSVSATGLTQVADAIVQARIRRAEGNLPGARAALAEGSRSRRGAPAWISDQIAVETAMIHLLDGQPGRALELPDSLAGSVRSAASVVRAEAELLCDDRPVPAAMRATAAGDDLSLRVQTSLLDALFQARRGDDRACNEAVERALRLAAPEHLRRPFREAPEPIRRALSTRKDLTARHSWLTGRDALSPVTSGRGAHDDAARLIEPLTDKEREVLALLSQLLTTEETAAAMYVSINTVRTHVRNILRKMGVAGRNQAIRRGRDLGILPAA